jgi:hypothetical protein
MGKQIAKGKEKGPEVTSTSKCRHPAHIQTSVAIHAADRDRQTADIKTLRRRMTLRTRTRMKMKIMMKMKTRTRTMKKKRRRMKK